MNGYEKMVKNEWLIRIADYISTLNKEIPVAVYEWLSSVLCLGVVVLIACKGIKRGLRYSTVLLLIEYVLLIFCSTILFRPINVESSYNWHPFWSYGKPELVLENIMNFVVFIPIGVLLGSIFQWSRCMIKRAWLITLVAGISISVSIEMLQYFLKRGFSETDDLIHNTLGCVVGFVIVVLIERLWLLRKRFLII